MNEELSINVTITPSEKDGKVSDIRIGFPKGQRRLGIGEAAHVLVSGVALLIRSHTDNKKSAHLMTTIMEHLNKEFVEHNSFDDAWVNPELLSENKDENK